MLRAADLEALLEPLTKWLKPTDDGPALALWKSRLSALAKLAEMVAGTRERKTRAEPFLKTELALTCVHFLAACGKPYPLSRSGDVAELAAAEFEWATGKATVADSFRTQIVALQELKRRQNSLEGDHSFLLEGGVFTGDLIETWVSWKRENEIDPVRLRPTPHEFSMYFDV